MKLLTIVVGPFAVNCYLLWDEKSGDGLIIDPGAEPDHIMAQIDQASFSPRAVLLTHGHGDHIAGVGELVENYQIPLYAGVGEEELLANPSANVSAWFDKPITSPPADHLVKDEEIVQLGSIELRTLATPGHSPGGVCYLQEKEGLLFCGDTLFAGSIGRTDFPGCSLQVLLQSINDKILTLPDEIVCLTGHGPQTTIGAERNGNPFLAGGSFV